MTHSELCAIGAKWLKKSSKVRCPIVAVEPNSVANEKPDVIGFNHMHSILIEVKTSRSDFLADKKKFFRIYPDMGMGDFRFYLCPEGVIKETDLPEKWGLIWVADGKPKVMRDVFDGPYEKRYDFQFEKYAIAERQVMYSLLRKNL